MATKKDLGPIETEERLLKAISYTASSKGYVYELIGGTVYWRSSSQSLWTPIQVIAFLFYSERLVWVDYDTAVLRIGLPEDLAKKIRKAIYPQDGYNKERRKRLLEAANVRI